MLCTMSIFKSFAYERHGTFLYFTFNFISTFFKLNLSGPYIYDTKFI